MVPQPAAVPLPARALNHSYHMPCVRAVGSRASGAGACTNFFGRPIVVLSRLGVLDSGTHVLRRCRGCRLGGLAAYFSCVWSDVLGLAACTVRDP